MLQREQAAAEIQRLTASVIFGSPAALPVPGLPSPSGPWNLPVYLSSRPIESTLLQHHKEMMSRLFPWSQSNSPQNLLEKTSIKAKADDKINIKVSQQSDDEDMDDDVQIDVTSNPPLPIVSPEPKIEQHTVISSAKCPTTKAKISFSVESIIGRR